MKRNENNLQNGIYFFKDSFICTHNVNEIIARQFPDHGKLIIYLLFLFDLFIILIN